MLRKHLKGKTILKAIIFKKIFDEFMAARAADDELDLSPFSEPLEEWRKNSPDDLNCVLATILIKAPDTPVDELQEEVEAAKEQYTAEEPELVPWFESQINNLSKE
ncbi:MAG: hypothetical protein IJP12_00860 [Methanobrevibacter sp.]|nr:hypothetical protein [Methanobrevibacter sp.]